MSTNAARAELVAEIGRWEGLLTKWEAEGLAATAERESLRERMGDEVLTDPTRANTLTAALAQCAATIEVAESASKAASPKLDAARRAVFEFDAAEFDRKARAARSRLETHEARKAELLQALNDFEGEGEFVPVGAREFAAYMASLPFGTTGTFRNEQAKPWKSDGLRIEAERFELKAQYLRDVVAGRDPEVGILKHRDGDGLICGETASAFYPPCAWGPEAIVPAALYVRRIDLARAQLAQHDTEAAEDIEPELKRLHTEIEKAQAEGRRRPLIEDDLERISSMKGRIRALRAKVDNSPAVRAQLVAELEALIGHPDLDPVEV